jgi:hypothetical protein
VSPARIISENALEAFTEWKRLEDAARLVKAARREGAATKSAVRISPE